MKLGLTAVALALAFLCIPAQAQDEAPGSQSQIVAAVPTGGFSCGRASYPENCYAIPANIGGTFWMDVYYNAYPSPSGFILFNNVADLGEATVTSATVTKNSMGQVASMAITFKGETNDGGGGTYTGNGLFTFSYYKGGCSGRGCGTPWVQILTSGTLKITYN